MFPSAVSRGSVYAGQTPDSKGEPGWGCGMCWLLVVIMPGSNHTTLVAGGSGQVSKKAQLWLAADSCLKTTGHLSQGLWFTSVMEPQVTPMMLSRNTEFTMCTLCCNTFPWRRGHLQWCDCASHSASAGWVDSISEDTLLLRYSQPENIQCLEIHDSWISVVTLSTVVALSKKEPRTGIKRPDF